MNHEKMTQQIMQLMFKQLKTEELRAKLFVIFMTLLSIGTSFMYFFVHFSVDGNLKLLRHLSNLSEDQIKYQNALVSNAVLARNILMAFIALTTFVFVMFYYRFFRSNMKQLGVLKALGFTDQVICRQFLYFTSMLSLTGGVIGLIGGFFVSDTLMNAGRESYMITEQVKGISLSSVLIGIGLPLFVFNIATYITYAMIRGKEVAGLIIENNDSAKKSRWLMAVNHLSEKLPKKNRLPMRLALRKPISVLLIIISVMSFSVMFILAYSLNLSSTKVVDSQLVGHHYLYETQFDQIQTMKADDPAALYYLSAETFLQKGQDKVTRTITGIEAPTEAPTAIFELLNKEGNVIRPPVQNEMIIGVELQELHGFKTGDIVKTDVDGCEQEYVISAIAENATMNQVYVSRDTLCRQMQLSTDSYNGAFSMNDLHKGTLTITDAKKRDALKRSTVSNKTSAVINQVMGCFIGCILLFLALYLNFSSSTREMLILHLMGYQIKEIKAMLLDLYRPILCLSFIVTLIPSVLLVKHILKSLSVQIGDYMPFQTNVFVIVGIFLLLNLIYFLVQATFHLGIRRIIRKEDISWFV
ncbi:MAG: ABC transporter permease [Clostridia bacterium]|nr:ABC transporter permease [Clostridia bacterium]